MRLVLALRVGGDLIEEELDPANSQTTCALWGYGSKQTTSSIIGPYSMPFYTGRTRSGWREGCYWVGAICYYDDPQTGRLYSFLWPYSFTEAGWSDPGPPISALELL